MHHDYLVLAVTVFRSSVHVQFLTIRGYRAQCYAVALELTDEYQVADLAVVEVAEG